MPTQSRADRALSAFADPDAMGHDDFRTSIFLTLLFSVLLLGFAAVAVFLLPIECVLSDSSECRRVLSADPV